MPDSRRPLALGSAAIVAVLAIVVLVAGPIAQDRLGASPGVTSPVSTSPGPGSSASPAIAWGPLAIFPPQDGADQARNEGTLHITDSCVVMERLGEVTLLTWPADRTSWDEASRTITFENFDGTIVTVADGDEIVVGGSGGGNGSEGEGDLSSEEYVNTIDWVAPPASSCSLESWWGVGAVEPAAAGPQGSQIYGSVAAGPCQRAVLGCCSIDGRACAPTGPSGRQRKSPGGPMMRDRSIAPRCSGISSAPWG